MTKTRRTKLRRRARRKAMRIPRGTLMKTGEIGHLTGVSFYSAPWESVEWTYRGERGITRRESEWQRRARYGGRKGRQACKAIERFSYEMAVEKALYDEELQQEFAESRW